VTITITPVNDAPVAVDDSYTTPEDTTLNVALPGVLANDSDVDGDALSAILVSQPTHGSLTLNPNGGFSYMPAANYNGTDSFTYKANDGQADSGIATVTITITPVNDAPVAVDDSYTTPEDTTLNVALPGVLANDSDADGDTLSAILVSEPTHGSLTLNSDGSFTYVPSADYNGTDSFTYKASDGQARSDVATVTITVLPATTASELKDLVLCPGESLSFTTIASGTGPFTYQWSKDGMDIARATNQTYTIDSVTVADAGTYSVVVSGAFNSVTNSATLSVLVPVTATDLADATVERGEDSLFSTSVSGSAPIVFEWTLDGTPIGTNGPALLVTTSGLSAGPHIVQFIGTGPCGSVTRSATLMIEANVPPTVTITSPADGAIFISPADINIVADARDIDGTISQVEFFQGTQLLGTTTLDFAPNLYSTLWTNVAPGTYVLTAKATDDEGATAISSPVNVTVIDCMPLSSETPKMNWQTTLFEQKVRVSNPTPMTLSAVRVSVTGLSEGTRVYNASGDVEGVPFVTYNLPLGPGESVELTIEYYALDRRTPEPQLCAKPVVRPAPIQQDGTPVQIDRTMWLADGTFMIEFSAEPGQTYHIQYCDDMRTWKTVTPGGTSDANRIQWIDNGQPKTESFPSKDTTRFYRVITSK
jgi:VCBS repeat-containing protein